MLSEPRLKEDCDPTTSYGHEKRPGKPHTGDAVVVCNCLQLITTVTSDMYEYRILHKRLPHKHGPPWPRSMRHNQDRPDFAALSEGDGWTARGVGSDL
jgi:hypothetical protein